jgi:hypothetical protein
MKVWWIIQKNERLTSNLQERLYLVLGLLVLWAMQLECSPEAIYHLKEWVVVDPDRIDTTGLLEKGRVFASSKESSWRAAVIETVVEWGSPFRKSVSNCLLIDTTQYWAAMCVTVACDNWRSTQGPGTPNGRGAVFCFRCLENKTRLGLDGDVIGCSPWNGSRLDNDVTSWPSFIRSSCYWLVHFYVNGTAHVVIKAVYMTWIIMFMYNGSVYYQAPTNAFNDQIARPSNFFTFIYIVLQWY